MNKFNVEKTKLRSSFYISGHSPPIKVAFKAELLAKAKCISESAFGGDVIGKELSTMRMILITGLMAAGIGLAGISGASAAPVNGAVIDDLATATDHVTPVQWGHYRWGSYGGHYRWRSYGGHYRWGSYGGHWRWGSRGWRRW